MNESVTWPLAVNIIRRKSTNNTFGLVRKRADGTAKPHQGWDFSAEIGTPFYAISNGIIRFIRDRGDYGVQLCLEFNYENATYFAFYAHLSKCYYELGENLSIEVEINTLLGKTGESGNAQGMAKDDQHLHFEIRTALVPRLGLQDRISPIKIFGKCPLNQPIPG
ncbi:M23 family metallopeptidase [Methylomicrobium lacus]|uniref:M23 family metallopeptidase n=1 Tax=Methylomicrobium lacus TaxID=136992 RepID=UPI0012683E30|nr:M23 family metallopeptidase [Methylomicrobium lacus]